MLFETFPKIHLFWNAQPSHKGNWISGSDLLILEKIGRNGKLWEFFPGGGVSYSHEKISA